MKIKSLAATRKPIHICMDELGYAVVLCDDGTIWKQHVKFKTVDGKLKGDGLEWKKEPSIPQDFVEIEVEEIEL